MGSKSSAEHLLYLASIDFPHLKARAIQVVNTCHALARNGCTVTLVVGRREGGPSAAHLARFGLSPHPALRIVSVPAFRLPPWAPRPLQRLYTRCWSWSYLAGCLAILPGLLRAQPGPIMVRDYRLAWLLNGLRRWHRRGIVFEVHGLPSAELLDRAQPSAAVGREAARRRRLEAAVFAGAWRLITITDCLRETLIRDYGVASARVTTVPDASHAPPDTAANVRREPASPGRPVVAYVGQLYPHKGVDLVVHALVQVPAADLLIVGGLPNDPQRTRLEQLVDQLGLASRVRFAGPQPYARVPELLAGADLAVLPLAEGLVARCFTSPLKLFDYLAAGLPIVAVDYPTIREVLRDGENGLLVRPDDPAALAAAINRLLVDPELAARLARQARHDASGYTWDGRARRLLAALGADAAPAPSTERFPRLARPVR